MILYIHKLMFFIITINEAPILTDNIFDFVVDAIILVFGAYILYIIIGAFVEADPGFAQYGIALFSAFIAGAVIFLKHALSSGGRL